MSMPLQFVISIKLLLLVIFNANNGYLDIRENNVFIYAINANEFCL